MSPRLMELCAVVVVLVGGPVAFLHERGVCWFPLTRLSL